MTEKLSIDEAQRIEWFDRNFKDIEERIAAACERSGRRRDEVIMLAATKTVPTAVINHAIESGVEYIGENRVQELLSKKDGLAASHRHFIGHLQTNKVKDIIGEVEMIESVHSLKLAAEIGNQVSAKGGVMPILVEVNIGNEESKSGFSESELTSALTEMSKIPGISVKGLMTIPPICENIQESYQYFEKMRKLFIDIKGKNVDNVSMEFLSMGMSGDFEQAIECGANIVRIGTSLFGQRDYGKAVK